MSERPPFPIERTPDGGYKLRELECWDCGEKYTRPRNDHIIKPAHRAWVAAQRNKTEITVFDDIPDEKTAPLDTTKRLVFGEVKVCPRCRGTLRPERKSPKGDSLPADTFTHDPVHKDGPCSKCKGTGVVQLARGG